MASPYPDLSVCGIRYMHFNFHVSGGLQEIDAFWEQRGLARSRERLLFAGYSRSGVSHTVFLQWERSHEGCSDVYLGVEARQPSRIWPRRRLEDYRLRARDFQDFIARIREMRVSGIRARYAYPWERPLSFAASSPANLRLVAISFDVLDDKKRAVMNVTYNRKRDEWLAVIEPTGGFPFPEEGNFFMSAYETACLLAKSLAKEPS